MRRLWRQRAARGAVLALLLHLALPWLTLHQPMAAPGPAGPFVICTGAGLVWIDAEDDAPEGSETAYNCPICFAKQLAVALPPRAPTLHDVPTVQACATRPDGAAPPPVAASAPPLPARGPPPAG